MSIIYLILYSISIFALISVGLAIIFGLMGVINLAHGEFMMLGAYTSVIAYNSGIPLILAILLSGVTAFLVGLLVERILIRPLYGRVIDTLLATWGLSLFLIGLVTTIFGVSGRSMHISLPSLTVFGFRIPVASLNIMLTALLLFILLIILFRYTKIGLIVRGAMQNSEIASAMGANGSFLHALVFSFGCGLAGIAGGVMAPVVGANPTLGGLYVAKAFIAVVVGGASPIIGTLTASGILGTIDASFQYLYSAIAGDVAMLTAAIIILRVLPTGITGRRLGKR